MHYVYGAAIAMLFPDTLCRLVSNTPPLPKPYADSTCAYSTVSRRSDCLLDSAHHDILHSSSVSHLHLGWVQPLEPSIQMSLLVICRSAGPESLEPLSEWAWSCFAGIVFGVHNHYILQLVGLVSG